jgi:hypothetical protein
MGFHNFQRLCRAAARTPFTTGNMIRRSTGTLPAGLRPRRVGWLTCIIGRLLKNSSVIPRSIGDDEFALRSPLNCRESRFLAALEMTPVGGVSPEFQQPVGRFTGLSRNPGRFLVICTYESVEPAK